MGVDNQPWRQEIGCFAAVPGLLSAKIRNDLRQNILKQQKLIQC
jgi:hypothetical protein